MVYIKQSWCKIPLFGQHQILASCVATEYNTIIKTLLIYHVVGAIYKVNVPWSSISLGKLFYNFIISLVTILTTLVHLFQGRRESVATGCHTLAFRVGKFY